MDTGKTTQANHIVTDQYISLLFNQMKKSEQTITTVEICTGGLLSGKLTNVSESDEMLKVAFVVGNEKMAHKQVNADRGLLKKYSFVSKQAAKELAKCGAKAADSAICLSVTGNVNAPKNEKDKNAGLVFIGCTYCGKTKIKEIKLSGSRTEIRQAAVDEAILFLGKCMGF